MNKALVLYIMIQFYSISWLPMGYKLVLLQYSYIWIGFLSFNGRIWNFLFFCHCLTRHLSINMVEKNLFFLVFITFLFKWFAILLLSKCFHKETILHIYKTSNTEVFLQNINEYHDHINYLNMNQLTFKMTLKMHQHVQGQNNMNCKQWITTSKENMHKYWIKQLIMISMECHSGRQHKPIISMAK